MSFADHFSGHAAVYNDFRPTYPAKLFTYLAGHCEHTTRALDVATGNGQAAVSLAAHFQLVLGCDASAQQLAQAQPRANLFYVCAGAELLPFQRDSMDLVCVAQAAHWFEMSRFNQQVDAILKPGGHLAIWCYGLFELDEDIDQIVYDYYRHTLENYWPEERRHVENGYAQLAFPYSKLDSPAFHIEVSWDMPQLLGYLRSWSASQRYLRATQHDPLPALAAELSQVWREPQQARSIRWPLHLLFGQKSY